MKKLYQSYMKNYGQEIHDNFEKGASIILIMYILAIVAVLVAFIIPIISGSNIIPVEYGFMAMIIIIIYTPLIYIFWYRGGSKDYRRESYKFVKDRRNKTSNNNSKNFSNKEKFEK